MRVLVELSVSEMPIDDVSAVAEAYESLSVLAAEAGPAASSRDVANVSAVLDAVFLGLVQHLDTPLRTASG